MEIVKDKRYLLEKYFFSLLIFKFQVYITIAIADRWIQNVFMFLQ